MNGPRPPGTWTARAAASAYAHLKPGHTYEVRQPFVDYDGIAHPAGERWRFLGHSFLPYDDGLSLFVSKPGSDDEWHVRLQDRAEEQADVIRALPMHVVPVDTTADVDGTAGMLPDPQDMHVSVRLKGWRWLALYGGYGFGVGAIVGAAVAMITLSNAPAQGALASAQWAGLWIFGCGLPFALLGLALGHATRKRVQREMLATAMPPGTSGSTIKRL